MRAQAPDLPLREGVSASTMALPPLAELAALALKPASLLCFLEHPARNRQAIDWKTRLELGLVCDAQGRSLPLDAPYMPGQRIFYWRDAGDEPRIAFDEQILYQDEHILVADKPHFLPVTPSGRYVKETLLVRLKQRTGLPDLTPMHRIDRDTAGLVMFCIRRQDRDAYAAMFRQRKVQKGYECIAPYSDALDFPLVRQTRLVTSPDSFMQMIEAQGAANSQTRISLIERAGAWARYGLEPVSGKRHQLRVHMNGLGLPIAGDGIYPALTAQTAQPDYNKPLQLLAKTLQFDDPVTQKKHFFRSRLTLNLLLNR